MNGVPLPPVDEMEWIRQQEKIKHQEIQKRKATLKEFSELYEAISATHKPYLKFTKETLEDEAD